jgi:hypothetical protein
MHSSVLSVLVPALLLLSSVIAGPIPRRQSSTTCGSNYYSSSQVSDAADQAYEDYNEGEAPDSYPHTYNNYEGFDFPIDGPYLEFPITEDGIYTGGKSPFYVSLCGADALTGSPGADRVVITQDGDIAGVITHTGASGDDFVGCSGTS